MAKDRTYGALSQTVRLIFFDRGKMLLASSGFITICPKKEVELGADRHLHRAVHAEELKKEIEFDCPKATGNQYAYLPGGGVRAINPNSSMTLAETENLIAVFKGNLFNKAELAVNVLGVHTPLGEAQLLLQLYAAKGLDMLGMLNGQFAFCLYDSKQARVLAARDHSGAVPLMEGRTAAGSLIIACGTFLPEGVSCMSDIKPGEYKYGWHALPRAFARGETRIVSGRASCDYGIRRRSIDAYNAPQRRSIDVQRGSSMDIPRHHSGSHHLPSPTSHSYGSYGHTPGRYMPPHLAAAGGNFSRQRATSFDGHNLHVGSSGSSHHHAGTPPASGGRRRSETNTPGSKLQPHPAPATQHWSPKSPLAAAPATSSPSAAVAVTPSKPAAKALTIQTTPATSALAADEVATPGSLASSTPSTASGSVDSAHRRKRRHHRRGRTSPSPNAASTAAAAAAADETNDGQASEADSQALAC
ncbi:hypothetical protein OEZ85_008073 [Tetradesmus obliquus]|uniref:Glutamine amidotransferase type-2 domain-containing protein n=1 Tax=Tetradesmus obliquus TaxID=3088 RepID=A0ABY8TI36_TETOB|nr:hypothetical protein OEZ85_008073 [Tetradesmus obliquus]